MKSSFLISAILTSVIAAVPPAKADSLFNFSTGNPTNAMASASRPDSSGKFEIESADDFVLTAAQTSLTSATFTGLITGTINIGSVTIQIYRIFPSDSNVGRTSGAPIFSTPNVPTRVNSPSDVEIAAANRSSTAGNLSFTMMTLAATFTALNSVQPGGIHPTPLQTTGGNGAITGQEVQFKVNFTTPINLPGGHYFFVPQVLVNDSAGNFFWLSAARPIVPPGTPFPAGFTDLQSWTRDGSPGGIEPDWLRIGMDIVGGSVPPTFNAAFSLDGVETPLPGALSLFATGLGVLGLLGWRRKRKAV